MSRRGRPLGEIARAVIETMRTQPMRASAIATAAQLSRDTTDLTLCKLKQAGYVCVVDTVPVPNRRPVAVYGLAEPGEPMLIDLFR